MNEKTAGQVYKKNINSVVYVSTQTGRGSGVVVGDNEVVTNCHVIDDGSPVIVTKPNADFAGTPQKIHAKVVAASPLDMCLLKTDGLAAEAVKLGESTSLEIGDPVYAIGNPNGIYGTLSSGIVSQIHRYNIQTTAAMSGGSSGGGLFDHEGRLVGITTGKIGDGESLHMALQVELVGHLRQRMQVEAPLHDELTAALNNPSAEKFRKLADRIAESLSHPAEISRTWRDIGVHEAERGDPERAKSMVKRITALAEKMSEHRDLIMVDAIHVLANLGGKGDAESLKSALSRSEKLGDKICRVRAFAHIVREWARVNIGKAREVCAKHFPFEEMLDRADPSTMSEIASTRAALEDSEQALRIANSIPDFGIFIETLARIAYELEKQKVQIGSAAIFRFAMDWAINPDAVNLNNPVTIPERLSALALIGYHAANCGARAESEKALRMMAGYQDKHGRGGEVYAASLHRKGLVAEARALCGDEMMGALRMISMIPVLGNEIAPALAISAIKLSQMPQ